MKRCMGNRKVIKHCQRCQRLPQDDEAEEADVWIDNKTVKNPCRQFREIKERK